MLFKHTKHSVNRYKQTRDQFKVEHEISKRAERIIELRYTYYCKSSASEDDIYLHNITTPTLSILNICQNGHDRWLMGIFYSENNLNECNFSHNTLFPYRVVAGNPAGAKSGSVDVMFDHVATDHDLEDRGFCSHLTNSRGGAHLGVKHFGIKIEING